MLLIYPHEEEFDLAPDPLIHIKVVEAPEIKPGLLEMANEQQFCLRWNNHQSTLVSVFDTLLESGTLVDCTLAAEGQYLKAHKVVLSACSPYFELLLSLHYEKHPIIILKDVKFQELKAMMDYMYRGEVNISQDQLGALLKAAESLQIKGLSDSGGGGTEKEPPEKKPDIRKHAPPVSRTPVVSHNSGLTIEQKRSISSSQPPIVELPADSPPPPSLPRGISSREGSSSPVPRKRKKHRRRSSGGDDGSMSSAIHESHDTTSNSSELPPQSVPSTSVSLPASITPIVPTSTVTKAPPLETPISRQEDRTQDSLDMPSRSSLPPPEPVVPPGPIPRETDIVSKVEPTAEVLLEPKAEYLEEDINEDSVEDLTLDDDDDDMDVSMDHARPGPSHGGEGSSQG
uniref:(California timema) hypothetical protein n=1 Tax=Timema californicum TaxID=61474 RepID=A0A7R9P2R4_TIMCA|nr:unnamed protein product [Timema californicum]